MHTESWQSVGPTLDECIKCNICASYCPVAAVTDLFPGPKYVGPQAQRFRENGQPQTPDHSVDYCSGCRVCNEVCPTGVHITEINTRARAELAAQNGIPLRNKMLGRNDVLAKLGSIVPGLANFGLHNGLSRSLADSVMGISKGAQLPRWANDTFTKWMKKTAAQRLKSDKKVVYYHGCSTQYYEPFVGKAAVAVFEHLGYEVVVPEQGCCGLPLLNNAEFPVAAKYHERNLNWLVPYARQGYAIVGTSTSCTLTLKEEAPEMLDMHSPEAHDLTMAVWDMFEWLMELRDEDQLKTDFQPLDMVLPYHAPCQYRAHKIGSPALEIMSLIPELDIRESHARCCGGAGTYVYKKEKYQIAMDVGAELFDFVKEQGSDVKMTACNSETCRWHIETGTDLPCRHPIEILAAAYGLYDLDKRDVVAL
ncbi:MAG: anaerobic glycerol-3-phosphate dehydrogenase subunit C [Anaerolineae bacterium]|nr:anaerobic glycerol-3-phosphate dehydrogenase subunit C [Anaerolineae bacterium]